MNIAKTNAVIVSLILIIASAVVFTSSARAQSSDVEALEAQIQRLLSELNDLENSRSTSSSDQVSRVGATNNRACFTFTRNLVVGSTGEDVRQLQRFLNSNPATIVASSGVGSNGQETTYYGPITAKAVSKFQEQYASEILTPLGLSSGTGSFYTSTRAKTNSLCSSSGRRVVDPNSVVVADRNAVATRVGDELSVARGRQTQDGYAVQGAIRVPYTTLVLTAGGDSIRVSGVNVRRIGLSSNDNFESVALVDQEGVQLGSARGLNSRNQATIGGKFIVPANSSVVVTVVGNVTSESSNLDDGAVAGLEIVGVTANADVEGDFPIRGAAHVFSSAVDLQTVEFKVSNSSNGTIDLDEYEEVFEARLTFNTSGKDEEDAFIKSITFEQDGNADEDEVGRVKVIVDGDDEYTPAVSGDSYTVVFPGNGYAVEDNDRTTLSIEVSGASSGETVQFGIEDPSDIYVVGAAYGYGLPVQLKNSAGADVNELAGSLYTINSGEIDKDTRVNLGDLAETSYGDDKVLSIAEYEIEGEAIEVDTPKFVAVLSGTGADDFTSNGRNVDEVRIENVYLEINGVRVANADEDFEFTKPTNSDTSIVSDQIEFTDVFQIRPSNNDVVVYVRGDLNSEWANFDGSEIEFILIDADSVEGVVSEDNKRNDFISDVQSSGLDISGTSATESYTRYNRFEEVEIVGNDIEFKLNDDGNIEDRFVAGSNGVVFGSFQVDARDAEDDVELSNVTLYGVPGSNSNLEDLSNCVLLYNDDEVADARDQSGTSASSYRFRFDRVTVREGERVNFEIACDVDDSTDAGDTFEFSTNDGASPAVFGQVEYEVGREDLETALRSGSTESIEVTGSGTLALRLDDIDNDSEVAVAVGDRNGRDDVSQLTITVEADEEDIRVRGIILENVTTAAGSGKNIEDVIERISISRPNVSVDSDDEESSTSFDDYGLETAIDLVSTGNGKHYHLENVNYVVEAGEERDFEVTFDYSEIDENSGVSGATVSVGSIHVVYEGEASDVVASVEEVVGSSDFTTVVPFRSTPTFSSSTRNQSLSAGNDRGLYEVTVRAADEGDIYIKKLAFDVNIDSGITLSDWTIKEGTSDLQATVARSGDKVTAVLAEGLRVRAGQSTSFSLRADVVIDSSNSGAGDSASVVVELSSGDARSSTEANNLGRAYNTNIGDNVWSPNSLENDEDETSNNADWFNSAVVLDSDDTNSWTSER